MDMQKIYSETKEHNYPTKGSMESSFTKTMPRLILRAFWNSYNYYFSLVFFFFFA